MGSSEQSFKISPPFGGGEGGSKRTIHGTTWLFTKTKKFILYVCFTKAVLKNKDIDKILSLCSLGGWHWALGDNTKTYDCKQHHVYVKQKNFFFHFYINGCYGNIYCSKYSSIAVKKIHSSRNQVVFFFLLKTMTKRSATHQKASREGEKGILLDTC